MGMGYPGVVGLDGGGDHYQWGSVSIQLHNETLLQGSAESFATAVKDWVCPCKNSV